MEPLTIHFETSEAIDLPASKSIGARYLTATYFAGTLPADNVFNDCEDLMVIQQALLNLYSDEEPIDYGETPLDCRSSGTAMRFVMAVCASTPGADFVITGSPRLCGRPMQPLIDVLTKAGADIQSQGPEGTGPYRVRGKRITGGEFDIEADVSSQFISALMMSSPTWEKGMKLNFTTPVRSRPYIIMTAKVMEKFGVRTVIQDDYVEVFPSRYTDPGDFKVKPDWSAASYFFEAALISGRSFYIKNITEPSHSWQGDSMLYHIFKTLGIHYLQFPQGLMLQKIPRENLSIIFDLSDFPDLLPALAVGCALSDTRFSFKGIKNLRYKESDRISVLTSELAKLGFVIRSDEDRIKWEGVKTSSINEPIDPHDDHRIAMAFAMVPFKTGEITIKNPEVVEKSYMNFWQQLPKTGLEISFSSEPESKVTIKYPQAVQS